MSLIVITEATPAQRPACCRLIYEIFCEEMGIMRGDANHERRIVSDIDLDGSQVLRAEVDGELAGTMGIVIGGQTPFAEHLEKDFEIPRFVSVVPRSRMAFNIRFSVKPRHRSTQLPFRMIVEAALLQIRRNIELVFCFCQPHLLNLYRSLGFRPYAPVFEVTGFGVVAPLVLIVPDVPHMREIRSPLLRYLPKTIEDSELAARIQALLPERPPVAEPTLTEDATWGEAFALLTRAGGRSRAFEDFSAQEISAFLERSHTLDCIDGQRIIVKGQDTHPAFVVLEGGAEVREGNYAIARFSEGELFGEFALLLKTRRTADVYAVGKRIRFLVLDERTLQRLLTTRPELAAKFLLNLSRSLALRLLSRGSFDHETAETDPPLTNAAS